MVKFLSLALVVLLARLLTAVEIGEVRLLQTYLGLFDSSGAPIGQPVRVPSGFDLRAQLDYRLLIATVDYTRPGTCTAQGITIGADPAIVDFDSGTYGYIGEPFFFMDDR